MQSYAGVAATVLTKPRFSRVGGRGLVAKGRKAKGDAEPVRCPLCGRKVEGAGEPAAALNRHFGTDCTWRHTSPSPARKK